MNFLRRFNAMAVMVLLIVSCAGEQNLRLHPPDYDHLIGRRFSDVIYKGRQVYRVVRESDSIEELENRTTYGCVLVLGVRKADDLIAYWRVDSAPDRCKVPKEPLNR